MSNLKTISLTVNGEKVVRQVEPRLLLADFLRNELNLTGTHIGCEHGICGACTLLVNGDSVRSCLTLAIQVDGAEVTTVEAHGKPDSMSVVQEKFQQCHGLQCGFCTPGMLATAEDLLNKYPLVTEEDIREGLSGNICRCTGYQNIVDAVAAARDEVRSQ
ncbi:(2Fe-2S)-binding protein [Pseudomaricurvus alkylphenolicus]|uniref:(2Fe-2S)-binding protein n=1 Tax=Pseudomaricurvus alkylphenolicus TaxID=1306991 RepID=UPI001420B0A0|nr:(2Fe-2S)-binding protein [Pseudomaricurvus alkylphenolicus]NIB38737.1 (2Fe-2S)-binding protein [Pseudomaricurvus alkylphenolicus]